MAHAAGTRRWRDAGSEGIVLALACLSPWAIGSVDARAELALGVGIALLAILQLSAGGQGNPARALLSLPSVALIVLVLYGLVQLAPLPGQTLRWLAPATDALRADLIPRGL